ncbi:hxnY, partial [Symbiodinium microadriaticum]
ERRAVALQIKAACEDIGFLIEEKALLEKNQDEYPFGYTSIGGEILQEMFSIGPSNPAAGMPPRLFPSNPLSFADKWAAYYDALGGLAQVLLQAFALSLDLPENYFEEFTDHHASAMRALNYPVIDGYEPLPGQLRASPHTDYGVLTILRSGGPGLQVSKDREPPTWIDVPFVENAFVINLGDLMRRWTNDRWQSTLHQVINPPVGSGWGRRQSIAFFYNLNRDARVEVLGDEAPKYEPIIAGDFLMQKHLASMKAKK